MKKLLIIISLFLSSCNEQNLKLSTQPLIVVKKDVFQARHSTVHSIRVFTGEEVKKYNVSLEDFNKIQIKDTLKNYIIE